MQSSLPPNEKAVRFSNVTIREYPMILGDHPDVSSGPPVTIDWEHCSEEKLSVDHHVTILPRRERCQMIMPKYYRKAVLKKMGYLNDEMVDVMKEIGAIKAQRTSTVRRSKLLVVEELKENVQRKMKKVFLRKKVTQEEFNDSFLIDTKLCQE